MKMQILKIIKKSAVKMFDVWKNQIRCAILSAV
jgi:hypothetical protein